MKSGPHKMWFNLKALIFWEVATWWIGWHCKSCIPFPLHYYSIAFTEHWYYLLTFLYQSIVLCSVIAIVFIPMNTSLCYVVAFGFHDIIPQKCMHFFPLQINTKSTKTKYKIQQNKKYNNNKYKIQKWMPCFPLQINTQTPAPKRLFTATDSIMFTASIMHSIMHIIMHSIMHSIMHIIMHSIMQVSCTVLCTVFCTL